MTQPSRWLRFNAVGIVGFMVQMLTLATLTHWLGVQAGIAIPVAVFVAVSHNFLWHERVTWPRQVESGRSRRWISFNLSTGLVSIVTNIAVTPLVLAATGVPLLAANAIAVVTASLLNFFMSDRLIFNHATARRTWPSRS
jgi:putative flippase GtrA